MINTGRIVVERIQQRRLELYLHRVVRLGALFLDVYHPPEAPLSDSLDVHKISGTHLVRNECGEKVIGMTSAGGAFNLYYQLTEESTVRGPSSPAC